jgi:hypothetical protein
MNNEGNRMSDQSQLPNITEKTSVKLTISSWYHVTVILATIIGLYFAVRTDVQAAVSLGSQNATELKNAQENIIQMRMDIRRVSDNVDWFRQQYERDMSKYIRDTPTK